MEPLINEKDCAPGSIVTFGRYVQHVAEPQQKEPVEWIVLERKNDKVLLISRFALDIQPYHLEWEDTEWKNCTLRTWLNGPFLFEAFSADERDLISLTKIDNGIFQGSRDNMARYKTMDEEWVRRLDEDQTEDRIFLLSCLEAEVYFKSNSERACQPTEYMDRKAKHSFCGHCGWWLRSPGKYLDFAESVSSYGSLFFNSDYMVDQPMPVRPALWMHLYPDKRNRDRKENEESADEILKTAERCEAEGVFADALVLFREAAESGNSAAQFSVGKYYEYGITVKQNIWITILWYQIAAYGGSIHAKEKLKKLQNVKRCTLVDRSVICWVSNYKAYVRNTKTHEWRESKLYTELLFWTRGDDIDEVLEGVDYDEDHERILRIYSERGLWMSEEHERRLQPCEQVVEYLKRTGQTTRDLYRQDHLSRKKGK